MTDRRVETDRSTMLAALADRLRVGAAAIRGMALDALDRTSVEGRTQHGLAADLDDAAARLDVLRGSLCRACANAEVVELLRAEDGGASESSPKPTLGRGSPRQRRRPRPGRARARRKAQ